MAHLKKRGFRRGRLSEQVVAELEKMMVEEYPAGARLPKESALADRFHVSRIVIREAMKLLEGRGVVQVRAGSGTYTVAPSVDKVKESLLRLFRGQASPSLTDLEEMLEVREVLEETVASLAAVRATEADLAEMEAALAVLEAGQAGAETVEADLRFHRGLVRAAHNPYFEMMLEPLTSLVIQQIMLTDSYEVGPALHRKILDAVRAGNSVGARQAARRLMRFTLEHTRKAIEVLAASPGPGPAAPG
jgi:DNA-binding FadR family transcriptional regulator